MCSENNCHKNRTEWRNFYGRFKGKSLSATQTRALLTEFKKYSLENISWEINPRRKKIILSEIFDNTVFIEFLYISNDFKVFIKFLL